jgi:hypothetical protein
MLSERPEWCWRSYVAVFEENEAVVVRVWNDRMFHRGSQGAEREKLFRQLSAPTLDLLRVTLSL